MQRSKNLFDPQGELPLTSKPDVRCVKRALKADGKGGLYLDCECGNKLSIPVIAGQPMTYECLCGITYDSRGWIQSRPAPRLNCGECLMTHVDVVVLNADGTCSCCATGHKLAGAVRR